jgi:glyoxylase-like metal-dependent hydrolase (beta-lactamase superfamily II)
MGATRIQIGDVEVMGLSDGQDKLATPAKYFPLVPDAAWEPYRRIYPGLFVTPTEFNWNYFCYILRSRGQTILVDAGIGPADTPESVLHNTTGRLLDEMAAAGVRLQDIDKVVLTHLHGDHVGWCVTTQSGRHGPTFPRARYVAHQADWRAFGEPQHPALLPYAYVAHMLRPLETEGRLDLVSQAEANVTSEVRVVHCPGHTPGSMVVVISSAGQGGFLWGDAITHPAQLAEPDWDYFFDVDKLGARRSRTRMLQQLDTPGMVVGAGHFGLGRVRWLDGRRAWQAV